LLVVYLGTLTTILSLILNNVTTIILIVPITIILARKLGINPIPILMSEVLLADIGGVATLVGDPPNIMIGSAANFSFNTFLTHSLPVVFVA
jgi:Na+/H+ antiporter NhaD/arsenite permease-like protein